MERSRQLTPVQAFEAIQKILDESEDTLGLTNHAIERATERHVTIDDVLLVLRRGSVSAEATWNDRFRNWEYVVTGLGCDSERIAVAIALIPSECRITVITVKDAS